MKFIANLTRRTTAFLAALLLIAAIAIPTYVPRHANALQMTSRKLTLSSSAKGSISTDAGGNTVAAGAGGNGTKAKHTINFTFGTTNPTDGSIIIVYCTSPIPQTSCTTPGDPANKMSASNLTAATVTGSIASPGGYSLDTTTSNATINTALGTGLGTCNGSGTTRENCVAVKRASPQAETGSGLTVQIAYGGGGSDYITNPDLDNYSFYARIFVFSDTAYTNANIVDYGGVAASTAQQIDITAKVQEILNFSVGSTYVAPGGSCTALNDTGAVALGDTNGVLSITTQYDNHSYFRVNSNTLGGTVIQYSGDTLKSGANSIAALSSEVTTAAGTESFGLALDSGDTGKYSITDLTTLASGYDEGNGALGTAKFNFSTGSVSSPVTLVSNTAPVTCDTGSVRYVGNINTTTRAGIYTTTISYIAIGTY